MGKKKQKLIFFILLLFLILGANFIYALEVKYPPIYSPDRLITLTTESTLPDYVNYVFYLALWIGIGLSFVLLFYAGFLYLTSFNNPERITSARQWIKAAILGLLILLTSILVLESINPQLTILELSSIDKIETDKREIVPDPELKSVLSSIHVKLPFGQLIMKIFETYNFNAGSQEPKKPRISRIMENTSNLLDIAEKLKDQNEKLANLTKQCSCYNVNPGNTPSGCSSDPCYNVRKDITENMDDNLEQLNLLKQERDKTIVENKELKTELDRLERIEKFIRYCPALLKDSYSQFLIRKEHYENQEGIVREFDFWDDLSIVYLNKEGKKTTDWATFVCLIGGNALSVGESPFEEELEKGHEEEIETWKSSSACSIEIPVGEIIDRAKRITALLINKLEQLIILEKEMIEAVDQMQVLISQCSSQRCTFSTIRRRH